MKITLEIFINKMVLSGESGSISVTPEKPFSTSRLLVGDFDVAEQCLNKAADKLGIMGLFKSKPSVVVKPRELIDGGISPVEQRIFRELAFSINARQVEVVV